MGDTEEEPVRRTRKNTPAARRAKRNYKQRLRERQLKALLLTGVEAMGDAKWEETQNAILFEMAQHPGPNAANQLKAIEVINKRRHEQKFGTRAAVEETRARCQAELKRIYALEQAGREAGVMEPRVPPDVGQQDAHREAGETSAGRSDSVEKIGVA